MARGETNNVKNVKIIISDSDFFLELCPEDTSNNELGCMAHNMYIYIYIYIYINNINVCLYTF